MQREASENPSSIASRLHRDLIPSVARDLARDLPQGSDQQRADWMMAHEEHNKDCYRPYRYYANNLLKLDASQRLEWSNGGEYPAFPARKGR